MPKTCKVNGCNNPVFTHGYCNYHKHLYYIQKKQNKSSSKLSPPKSPINTLSKKKSRKKAKIALSKKKLIERNGQRCFFCGKEFAQIDLAHIFPISLFEEYETEEWNHILACRKHHAIFDDGTFDEISKLENVYFILEIIELVDNYYFHRLKQRGHKHG